jgi:carboxyl-terminal processing protease
LRTLQLLLLLSSFFILSAFLFRSDSTNQSQIEGSLSTLAEILTLTQHYASEDVESKTLVEGAIDGLLGQLDPHSNFYNAARYQTMREDQAGSFHGIGVIVGYHNNQLTVVSPMEGTPAYKAGLRPGDVITAIGQKNTKEMDLYDAIRLLRGQKGSRVTIGITRIGLEEPLVFNLERDEIPSSDLRAYFMIDETTGYVSLRDFGETATEELTHAIINLQTKGMEQLVLDLRGNPGGLLPQAIDIASLFVPGKKLVVSTQGRLRNSNQEYFSRETSPVTQVPMLVLIDRGSASASEIVAGAVQDHDRGLIVGVSSWGKGLVQSVFPLSDGSKGLALTTARYYTPSGRNIQGSYDSLADYYNPESAEELYFNPESQGKANIFKTVHGREVLEVRGITPDVYIGFEAEPREVQSLEANSLFFNFSIEHPQFAEKVDADWVADEAVMTAFNAYLKAKEHPKAKQLANHQEWVRRKITYEYLQQKDPTWSWSYLMRNDRQVKAALQLRPEAKRLFQVYQGEADWSEDETAALKQYATVQRENAKSQEANTP